MKKGKGTGLSKQRIWFYVAFFVMGLSLVNYFTSDGSAKEAGEEPALPRVEVLAERSLSLPSTPSSTSTTAPSRPSMDVEADRRNPFAYGR